VEESDGVLFPPSLKRKAREVEHRGGIRNIRMRLDELSAISKVNQSTLEDMERLLYDEEADNEKMKAQHQDRWITSAQADAVSHDVVSCRQVVLQAAETDKWLRNQCESFIGPLEMLTQLESVLRVPPPDRVEVYTSRSSAAESLRQLMIRVEEIETQRRLMENQLKTTEADIKSILLQIWSTDGAIEEQRVLSEQLDHIYGSLRQRVGQSIELQDPLISEIHV
jgi:ALIX V-shaped domain binding to HIV